MLVLLFAYKINFPKTIIMLRGNHECRQMTSYFNFRQEVLSKYDQDVYDLIMESFDAMPLSCIVNEKFIALHGGISPELKTVSTPFTPLSSTILTLSGGLENPHPQASSATFCGPTRTRMKMVSKKSYSKRTRCEAARSFTARRQCADFLRKIDCCLCCERTRRS